MTTDDQAWADYRAEGVPESNDPVVIAAEKIALMIAEGTHEGAMATRYGVRAIIEESEWERLDAQIAYELIMVSRYSLANAVAAVTHLTEKRYSFLTN